MVLLLLRTFENIGIGIGYCQGLIQKLVLVLGIVKASLEILGIGIGVKKVVLLRSAMQLLTLPEWLSGTMELFENQY